MSLPNPLDVITLLGKTFAGVIQNPTTATYDPTVDDSQPVSGATINVDGIYYQGGPSGFSVAGESDSPIVYEAVFIITAIDLAAGIAAARLSTFPLVPNSTSVAIPAVGLTYSTNAIRLRSFNGQISGYEFLLGR